MAKEEKQSLMVVNKSSVQQALLLPERQNRLLGFFGNQKDVNRFVSTTINCIATNPKLAECSATSFHKCLDRCASYKLFPDNRTATLVPFKTQATFLVMAQGYIELFARNGILIKVVEVCENDTYREINGVITHEIDRLAESKGKRGTKYGYVVYATMPDGRIKSEFITLSYIDKCRSVSRNPSLWEQWTTEMEKKTCIRYIAKTLPQTSEIRQIIEADDQAGYSFEQSTPMVNASSLFGENENKTEPSEEADIEVEQPSGTWEVE